MAPHGGGIGFLLMVSALACEEVRIEPTPAGGSGGGEGTVESGGSGPCTPGSDGALCDDADPCTTADACAGAVCSGEPIECASPPPSECLDAATLRTYAQAGTCSTGECSYSATTGMCPGACTAGACQSLGVWTAMSDEDAPEGRGLHTTVWTGSQMIVWGGDTSTGLATQTGGRYDSATDTWTPTSISGAPAGRSDHVAVWTGSEMLVWGGGADVVGESPVKSGGRYNPASDTWAPMSTVAAPLRRMRHAAVWTGSHMIVWGGQVCPDGVGGCSYNSTGGAYDPATDTWSEVSTDGAPSGREFPLLAWTGSEMIVWGGSIGAALIWDGGRYDPATDTWSDMAATTEATGGAYVGGTAVWTGAEMIVWGNPGAARFDPEANVWAALLTPERHSPYGHDAVAWSGQELLVWGMDPKVETNVGVRFSPTTESWAPMSEGGPAPRAHASVV